MAKRRTRKVRRASTTRRVGKVVKRRSTSKNSKIMKSVKQVALATTYGFGRATVNETVRKGLNAIGLNAPSLTDEMVLLGTSLAVQNNVIPGVNKIPFAKDIANQGVTIEGALVGQQLAQMFLNRNRSSTAVSTESTGMRVIG